MNIQLPRFSFLISACLLALSATAVEVRHNQLGMPFVLIPSGEFLMGINPRDLDTVLFEMETPDPLQLNDESPQHLVKISKAYWLGQTEVTQAQWLSVMHTRPGPAENWKQADWKLLPVVSTSWNMAQAFVTKLSKLDKKYNYRLPSEAEWEYAARAGSNELRPVAVDKLDEYAWSLKNSGDIPHPVATRKVSAFGLYDMLGNAWEWVNDRYSAEAYLSGFNVDPTGPSKGMQRLRRGGSYHCPLFQMRPGFRSADPSADTKYTVTGFRIIATEKEFSVAK